MIVGANNEYTLLYLQGYAHIFKEKVHVSGFMISLRWTLKNKKGRGQETPKTLCLTHRDRALNSFDKCDIAFML